MEQQQETQNKRTWLWPVITLVVFIVGIQVGKMMSVQEALFSDSGAVDINKVVNLYSNTRSEEVNFDQFWDVWDRVKEQHVEQPVQDVALFYGALQGMVAGLDDPYSVYLPPEQAAAFARDLAGSFEGIGAEIGIRDQLLQVIAPLPDSPAQQAGLRPGDTILAIDGAETFGMSLEEAVLLIRGEKGTEVVLTITRNGFGTAEDVSIVRDTISVPTVTAEMFDEGIAYIRISHFNQETWDEFDTAVKELLPSNPRGIILDVRSNPGGFLETAIDVASEWVESGIIVSEGLVDAEKKDFLTRGRHRFAGTPTVVLIDEGSASGSEIVAGALGDNNAATIIGAQSFGKGSVQDFQILPDGSALKLTIAKWFTPNGDVIDGEGIVPDVIVEEMFGLAQGDERDIREVPIDEVIDFGLERAKEALK